MRQSNKPQSEMTAHPSKYPQGGFKKKPCRTCKNVFQPLAPCHHYCSEECKSFADTDRYYKRKYGIGYAEVKRLEESQENVCAICKGSGFKMHQGINQILCLDHCHTTGQVRGLLCHNCNRALGLLQDNTDFLKSAIEYLEGATTISKESTLK